MAYKALVAEDDVCLNDLVVMSLGNEFTTHSAFSVHQVKSLADHHQFDVVILDYYLPDGNGVELAEFFQQQPEPPVIIFLSAAESLDAKMAGFDCGASDWLDKREFTPAIFHLKVLKALENKEAFHALRQAEQESNQLVFDAMSDSFVWGGTARAIQNSLSCSSFEELLVSIYGFAASLEVNLSIAINENTQLSYWDSPHAVASGMEQDLFKIVMQKEARIISAGRRSFFQDTDVCLLIKNMPENEVKLGQFNDIFAAYVECLNRQIQVLNKEYIKRLYFKRISHELANLKRKMGRFNSETQAIQTKQSLEFFEIFSQLELTTDEESKLTTVTDATLLKFEHLANAQQNLIISLDEVIEDFQRQLK